MDSDATASSTSTSTSTSTSSISSRASIQQEKRRRIAEPEDNDNINIDHNDDEKRQPRLLYGIDVNNHEWIDNIATCPVYFPTRKDFENPFALLHKISSKASHFGICKIVCPFSDINPTGCVVKKDDKLKNFKFETSVQPLKYGTWATDDEKISYHKRGVEYTYEEFEKMANEVFVEKYSSFACVPCKMLEREFWQEMACGDQDSTVEYGVNIEGTAFSKDDELGRSKWNLKVLPHLPESTLRLVEKEIPGVTDPMLYIGMVFSTFAWHVEDHYLYSINYLHSGAPKTWYGVSGNQARNFEKVVYNNVYSEDVMPSYDNDGAAQVLSEKTTMLPPSLFMENHIPVHKVVQMPGEFVITFPRSYHAGFSHGFNCAEAVNFSVGNWFPYGSIAIKRYSFLETRPIIPFEELLSKEAVLLCQQMKTCKISMDSSSQDYSSNCSIMASCMAHIAYHRAALRKLERQELYLDCHENTLGTILCGFCNRDRYLAYIMCHHCRTYPTCVYHGITVMCNECRKDRSLFLSDNIRQMEAAADYFEKNKHLLSKYLDGTVALQQEIKELYELDRFDGKEASSSTSASSTSVSSTG